MELAGGQIVQLVGGCIGQLDGSGNSPAMLVSPQIRPIGIVELLLHYFVEFFAEQRQVRAAARMFFVEPSHQNDVRYRCDVPAPVPPPSRGLRHRAQHLVAFEDRLDVLPGFRNDDGVLWPRCRLKDEPRLHHCVISVTDRLPVPLPRMAAIFCDGPTVKYSGQLGGSSVSVVTAVGVPSPIRTRVATSTTTRI